MSSFLKVTFIGDYATVSMNVLKEHLLDFLPKGFDLDDIHFRGDNEEMFSNLAIQIAADFISGHYGWDVRSIAEDIDVEEG
jgi:hypothetical protein